MSKVLSTVGKVAGIVASVAVFIPGGQPIAAVAAVIAVAANVGAEITAKPPPKQGSVSQTTIGTDQPSCELLGRTYSPGARAHLVGYGAELKKVKNPYLLATDIVSVGGPLDGIESYLADMVPISFSGAAAGGYFGGFLWASSQVGQQRETTALPLHFPNAPGWSAASRLSGKAAIAWNALFDRDGNVFASGLPAMGSVWRGVKAYDPRKDSTYPGGSGSHRWADPRDTAAFDAARATWEYTTSPGLLALRNALGTWERDETTPGSVYRKVFGAGIAIDGLIVADFVTLANVCDANGWQCGGRIFEPSNRWDNLKRILQAGGAQPAWRGGLLGVNIQAPRIALDTITADDLADGEVVVGAMQGWERRLNTLWPKYRSEAHRWEHVATTERVQIASQLAEDGEEKLEEREYQLVQDATQARQLCAYELMDRRELGEIELPCKPRLRRYGPGDLLIVDLPEAGLAQQPAVVLKRSLDPVTMSVNLVLRGETIGKHAFALGLTGTAPPTPMLRSTADIDGSAATSSANGGVDLLTIANSAPLEQAFITSTDAGGGAASITIAAHTRRYADKDVAVTGATLTGLANATYYDIFYDDLNRTGGAVTYATTQDPPSARLSADHPGRHYVGFITTAAAGGAGTGGGGATPPGGGYCVTTDTLILMADGTEKRAGDLRRGDRLRTRHEGTLLWGDFTVSAVTIVREPILHAEGYPDATAEHRFWTEADGWFAMSRIGRPAGWADVVRITVPGAGTYVSRHPAAAEGVLSHNLKQQENQL